MVTTGSVRQTTKGKYCGRGCGGYYTSPFHNPFHLKSEADRENCVLQFAVYWYSPGRKKLRELALQTISENEVLLCWCEPRLCHTRIIAGYVNAVRAGLFKESV